MWTYILSVVLVCVRKHNPSNHRTKRRTSTFPSTSTRVAQNDIHIKCNARCVCTQTHSQTDRQRESDRMCGIFFIKFRNRLKWSLLLGPCRCIIIWYIYRSNRSGSHRSINNELLFKPSLMTFCLSTACKKITKKHRAFSRKTLPCAIGTLIHAFW